MILKKVKIYNYRQLQKVELDLQNSSFEKYLGECYDKMSSRFLDISNPDCKEKETKLYFIKEELLKLYCHASLEKCYFCNSNYENATATV